jgi:hypothetical protein
MVRGHPPERESGIGIYLQPPYHAANLDDTATMTGWAVAPDGGPRKEAEHAAQANVVRDIFGNPFRPLAIDRGRLTPTIVSLARAAYDERMMPQGLLDPARLAVLADALEEAGCDNEEVLSHLRLQGASHYRGCWVLDLILARKCG